MFALDLDASPLKLQLIPLNNVPASELDFHPHGEECEFGEPMIPCTAGISLLENADGSVHLYVGALARAMPLQSSLAAAVTHTRLGDAIFDFAVKFAADGRVPKCVTHRCKRDGTTLSRTLQIA